MTDPLQGQTRYWIAVRKLRVPLGFVFAALFLWRARPTWLSLAAGAALVLPGLALRAAAAGSVKKNTELATGGPYAYTRNPLYLGSLLIAVGFALAGMDPYIGVGIVALLLAIYLPVIRSEETYLRMAFPEFEAYAARVPRLFPRLHAPDSAPLAFSRALYLRHREYNALIGTVALFAALIGKIIFHL
jgi:protein-S-isoprenylcysteine O-methyltransferase Ste14